MKTLTRLPAVDTPNLVVCEMTPRHAKGFAGFMTQPRYQRYTAVRLRTDAEVKVFVARSIARQGDERRNVFHLAAEERSSGEAIGDGFIIAQQGQVYELGWGVHPAMWSMGFGREIGQALLGLSFERLKAKRVWCKIMCANVASTKLAKRIGMRHEKPFADYPIGDGRFEAVDIYAMTAEEYFERAY
jgi:[ribosomal protein S5]-alanine N-acetyltransferase